MIVQLKAKITPILCSHLKYLELPITLPFKNKEKLRAEINLIKSTDDQNVYNAIEIKIYSCEIPMEKGHILDTPEDKQKVLANELMNKFLTILSFCQGFPISTEEQSVKKYSKEFNSIPENDDEKVLLEKTPRNVTRQHYGGVRITTNATTNDDIIKYWDFLNPISFFVNADKAESPIFKIREYRRIFEYFDKKFKDKPRFSQFRDKALTREIINEYTGQDISVNKIGRWWRIDSKCSHGGANYITSLNQKELSEVQKTVEIIRSVARNLIEGIALK